MGTGTSAEPKILRLGGTTGMNTDPGTGTKTGIMETGTVATMGGITGPEVLTAAPIAGILASGPMAPANSKRVYPWGFVRGFFPVQPPYL